MQRQNTFRELRNFLSGIWGDQYVISREQGSKDPLGALDEGVGKGELFFSDVIPLGFTKLYLWFVSFDSLCPSERFFDCDWMGLPGLTSTKYRLICLLK